MRLLFSHWFLFCLITLWKMTNWNIKEIPVRFNSVSFSPRKKRFLSDYHPDVLHLIAKLGRKHLSHTEKQLSKKFIKYMLSWSSFYIFKYEKKIMNYELLK